ncbi:MAG TPA: hypothetical protein ENL09_02570 [Bacteroidetes bacterium]|nr:hypothetical protein [Bacteroidota bacterium]
MKKFNIGELGQDMGVEPEDFVHEVENTMIAVGTMYIDEGHLNEGETKYVSEVEMVGSGKKVRLTVEYFD